MRGAVLAAEVISGEKEEYVLANDSCEAKTLRVNSQFREHFDKQYEAFRAAYPALKPIFRQLLTP